MRLEQVVQDASCMLLDRILEEYKQSTTSTTPYCLLELLSPAHIRLDEYCKPFTPHPDSESLKKQVKDFCEQYGIWLPGAQHYITCAIYLFPSAPLYRIIPTVKNNVIDFYLNDVMGREVFPNLSQLQQTLYGNIKESMAGLYKCRTLNEGAKPIEIANFEMLREIAATSTQDWFEEFLRLYCYHIDLAHRDCNASGIGHILTLEEYVELRCHVSGMPHTVMLIEYCQGKFLDWKQLRELELSEKMRRLNWVVSLIGCLMNDLFSFEKEVIDNACESNLVMVLLMNKEGMSLSSAITGASAIVRNLIEEFFELTAKIRNAINGTMRQNAINEYLIGLERCVQASWVWQVYTKRYKRVRSMWKETNL